MRDILHAPAFQALEAAWRGLFFLVRRLETGSDLKVYLVDISREELAADLGSTDDLTRTAAHKLLVDGSVGTPGADPWAVFAGNYVFDASMQSAALLGRIAKIAQAAGAPFVAGASPAILGSESLSGVPDPREWKTGRDSDDVGWWEAIRRLPDSVWLGLALPRFLLRLPYGKDTDSTERFHFEEMPGSPSHEAYLWANASIACAYLLGEAFTNEGWELTPGAIRDISGLPLHIYKEDGQAESKPCAEGLISDRAADAIAAQGLMPLLSRKDDDAVRLAFIRSIAFPPATLRGRWS
jgi:type VI secretion system protein ImpC